jgi:hypothetical protein
MHENEGHADVILPVEAQADAQRKTRVFVIRAAVPPCPGARALAGGSKLCDAGVSQNLHPLGCRCRSVAKPAPFGVSRDGAGSAGTWVVHVRYAVCHYAPVGADPNRSSDRRAAVGAVECIPCASSGRRDASAHALTDCFAARWPGRIRVHEGLVDCFLKDRGCRGHEVA